MSKVKMRCTSCGKWFQSANAKDVTCPDCAQKARKEKLAAKNTPPIQHKIVATDTQVPKAPAIAPKPKATQGGTNQWLDKLDDVKIAEPEPPPQRPKISTPPAQRNNAGPGSMRGPGGPDHRRDQQGYGPGAYRDRERASGDARPAPSAGLRPRQPVEGSATRGPQKPWSKDQARSKPRPKAKTPRPASPPKPKREKIPPPPPFVPTPEQIQQVEERYQQLAQPAEYDGIRTQIAQELSIPKKAVKTIIKDFRSHQSIPSWWELQTYKGSLEEKERIKSAYQGYLPVPPVGVHKLIATTLELKPGIIYQAIKAIRQELNLPQYNDPTLHEGEAPVHAEPALTPASHQDEPYVLPDAMHLLPQTVSATAESAPDTNAE